MGLPKKGSKSICVNNIDYRYIISKSILHDDFIFNIKIAIQLATGFGPKLLISGIVSRDFWLDFPDVDQEMSVYLKILPKHVEKFIKDGLNLGWNPSENGADYRMLLDNKTLTNNVD